MIIVDFTKKNRLNESVLRMIGTWTKTILKHMYGKDTKMVGSMTLNDVGKVINEEEADEPNFVIRGKYRDVKAYASAIVREKEYLDAYSEYGKDHPQTAKARANLKPAVAEFESATGIKWPFVDEE
jgi:hypothetical protein|tara:strand:- start:136 stop:513 length:378 start_codon:yes stop_codon:yes gene_type:complete